MTVTPVSSMVSSDHAKTSSTLRSPTGTTPTSPSTTSRTEQASEPETQRPHHKRTRSSGEQRGTTGKGTRPDEAAARPFTQVSARIGPKSPQLPKLRAFGRSSYLTWWIK